MIGLIIGAGAIGGWCAYRLIHFQEITVKRNWVDTMQRAVGTKDNKPVYSILKLIKNRYGFDAIISIPKGLSYEKLESLTPEIESGIGCVLDMEWKRYDYCAYAKMAMSDFDEKEEFTPVGLPNTELYFGETLFREHVTADMLELPHVLIVGATGSGKSRCFFIVLTNLIAAHDDIDLYGIQVSDKKDLEKFAHVKQCKYFARNLQTADMLMQYLCRLKEERNREINKYKLNNFMDYNEKFPDKKMNAVYIAVDEFEKLMYSADDDIDVEGNKIKKRIIYNFRQLLNESRSAGMYAILCEQRPDRVNMDPNIKMNCNVIVGFRANNKATALTMTDDTRTLKLNNRTALFLGSYDKYMQTLYIDDDIIKKYIGPKVEPNHKYVNIRPAQVENSTPKQHPSDNADKVTDKPKKKKARGDVKIADFKG